jgi:hypothetical protein
VITTVLRLADGRTVSIVLREVSRRSATALEIDGRPAQEWIDNHSVYETCSADKRKRFVPKRDKWQAYRVTLAQDSRLFTHAKHTQAALIDQVMAECHVTRNNAKRIIGVARQHRAERAQAQERK